MAENIGAKMADSCADSSEPELTMCDVLEEEKELEDDANAVLGDCDDTNCTYNVGYVPRQALYACSTCKSSDVDPGGVCLACSYACHEGHELVELYTKRNFRCDCGNKRFPNNSCRLLPGKEDFNSKNAYNQNFKGVYCVCSRPYPDLEDEVLDEMIQCVVCEDWYHGRHLGQKPPDNEDYAEMICSKCMDSHSFLYSYKAKFETESIISVVDDNAKEKVPIKKESTDPASKEASDNQNSLGSNVPVSGESPKVKAELGADKNGTVKEGEPVDAKPLEFKKPKCSLKLIKDEGVKSKPGFFPGGWRLELCVCDDCKAMYEEKKCLFLIDESDTIQAYEERGKFRNGNKSQYEKGMSALSQMDRVKQMEAIRGYKNMKDRLKDYFKTFAEEGRAVSADDIKEFFDGMQQSKRRRLDVPFYCR